MTRALKHGCPRTAALRRSPCGWLTSGRDERRGALPVGQLPRQIVFDGLSERTRTKVTFKQDDFDFQWFAGLQTHGGVANYTDRQLRDSVNHGHGVKDAVSNNRRPQVSSDCRVTYLHRKPNEANRDEPCRHIVCVSESEHHCLKNDCQHGADKSA